jgi:hypothetical protein
MESTESHVSNFLASGWMVFQFRACLSLIVLKGPFEEQLEGRGWVWVDHRRNRGNMAKEGGVGVR